MSVRPLKIGTGALAGAAAGALVGLADGIRAALLVGTGARVAATTALLAAGIDALLGLGAGAAIELAARAAIWGGRRARRGGRAWWCGRCSGWRRRRRPRASWSRPRAVTTDFSPPGWSRWPRPGRRWRASCSRRRWRACWRRGARARRSRGWPRPALALLAPLVAGLLCSALFFPVAQTRLLAGTLLVRQAVWAAVPALLLPAAIAAAARIRLPISWPRAGLAGRRGLRRRRDHRAGADLERQPSLRAVDRDHGGVGDRDRRRGGGVDVSRPAAGDAARRRGDRAGRVGGRGGGRRRRVALRARPQDRAARAPRSWA